MDASTVGGDYFASALPKSRNVMVSTINRAIRQRLESIGTVSEDGVYVCDATKEEWRQYVKSESQALRSRAMEWRPIQDNSSATAGPQELHQYAVAQRGRIYIIELPSDLHDATVAVLGAAFTTAAPLRVLMPYLATYAKKSFGDLREPDLSFGPRRGIGAVMPPEYVVLSEFHTIKVEIGVSRGWPYLNEKAAHWATFPGLVYILLVRISPGLERREYALYEVDRPANAPPVLAATPASQQYPATIEDADAAVPTTIRFNARRVLALPAPTVDPAADALLQNLFPTGEIVINLTEVVDITISQCY